MIQTIGDILRTPLAENQSVMAIMISYEDGKPERPAGDYKVTWDRSKPEEVAHVRKTFNEWRANGYMAYKVRPDGQRAEVIKNFDPDAQCIIFAPPMQGGAR